MPDVGAKSENPESDSRNKKKRRHISADKRLERDARVVELRRSGMTYDAIARECELADSGHAYDVYRKYSAKHPSETVDEARELDCARLDLMLRSIWWRIEEPDKDQMWAVDRGIKIVELQSKIKGTIRPVRQEVSVLTESVVDQGIAALIAQNQARALEAGVELPALPATAEVMRVERNTE
jgi:hypothetical protein